MIKQIIVGSIVTLSTVAGFMQAQPRIVPETPPTDVVAWILGTKLGMAALGNEAGESDKVVNDLVATSSALAESLGTKAPIFPTRSVEMKVEFSADLLVDMFYGFEPISRHLEKKYNRRHADLFELAIKSSALAMAYKPGDEQSLGVAKVVENKAKRCMLPENTWKPLVDSIRAKEPFDIVSKIKLQEMHKAVREHLLSGI